jgi:hypothetical protein
MTKHAPHLALRLVAAGLALAACAAGAQQVYRIVGPDGKVTFSDKPPVDPGVKAGPAHTVPLPGGAQAAAGPAGSLPFELRQVSARYPVTIYTGPNCGPCGSGRAYLSQRGVPYTEKTVSSAEDIEALNRLSGNSAALPLLTVGSQQLKGYSEAEWTQFLDAAGYPRTSQLPAGYRNPPAAPLVVAQPVRPAPSAPLAAEPAPSAPAAGPTLPAGDNPAGITF